MSSMKVDRRSGKNQMEVATHTEKDKKKNHDVVPRKSLMKNFSQGQFPGKQILYATSTYLAQLVNGLSGLDKTIIDSSERRSLWECIDRTLLKISDVSVIEERLECNGDF